MHSTLATGASVLVLYCSRHVTVLSLSRAMRKLWLTPTTRCRAVTLPRREISWGCPKLTKGSQPLEGRSSPYCKDMWRRYCCLTNFFPIVDTCLSCEDITRRSCAMVPRWRFLATFLRPVFFSEPRAAGFRPASEIRTKATPCVEVW